ncbi:MAG: hypothetical protein J6S85_01735 [Methanobrevibacter sp.]|nr:hypothetical protein [Methanobrevibacter sp.]MBO7712256.1 hypothetical protein [Methanobrevibacter sp.]
MGELANFTNALLGATRGASKVIDDYTTNQAQLSTQSKQIKLQSAIQNELMKIKMSSDYENWHDDMNSFFEKVKNGMSDKNSVYYCRNNLEAMQFTSILEQNQVGINAKIDQLVFQEQRDKALIDYSNNLPLLADMYRGEEYYNIANEGARNLRKCGFISATQLQEQYNSNYRTAYSDMRLKAFRENVRDGIAQNKSAEEIYSGIEALMPEIKAINTDGLPIEFDKEALDAACKKAAFQEYEAIKKDIQDQNANKLSEIYQQMKQTTSAEGRLTVARRGQYAMNQMLGLQLSEADRISYAMRFDLKFDENGAGDGSGGSSGKPQDSYKTLIESAPETIIQMVRDGDVDNIEDAINVMNKSLLNDWFENDYKENYGKDMYQRNEDFNKIYKGKISKESLTDIVLKKCFEKYPTISDLVSNKFKALKKDLEDNPKKYGAATVGKLADFLIDTALGANDNLTDDEFKELFEKHINNYYIEKVKYLEFDKNNKLKATFNPKKEKDVIKAIDLANNDYVFTYGGKEIWAEGKKEALEAKGGVVDTLRNAVIGTLDIPDSDVKNGLVGTYYKPDPEHNDMTSVPIFTYKNNAYEVIKGDDNKSYHLRNIRTGEVVKGKIGNGKAEREENKEEAKEQVKAAGNKVSEIENNRKAETNRLISEAKSIPKAVKASGKVKKEEWETTDDVSPKQIYLNEAERAINKDANKLSAEAFFKKYGIELEEWQKTNEITARYRMMLK